MMLLQLKGSLIPWRPTASVKTLFTAQDAEKGVFSLCWNGPPSQLPVPMANWVFHSLAAQRWAIRINFGVWDGTMSTILAESPRSQNFYFRQKIFRWNPESYYYKYSIHAQNPLVKKNKQEVSRPRPCCSAPARSLMKWSATLVS